MKDIFIFLFCLIIFNINIAQKLETVDSIINETITTIKKEKLFKGWQKLTIDTLSPTFIKVDLNKNGVFETVGLYEGIENGLFIFENNNSILDEKYRLLFYNYSKWYSKEKFQAIINLIKQGTKVKNKDTGAFLSLENDSVLIIMNSGDKSVITYMNDKYIKINII